MLRPAPRSLPRNRNNASDAKTASLISCRHEPVCVPLNTLPRKSPGKVVSSPHLPGKKEMPGTECGKKFAVSSSPVGFTRCRQRVSSPGSRCRGHSPPPGGLGTASHKAPAGTGRRAGEPISMPLCIVQKSREFQRHCDVQVASSCFDAGGVASHREASDRRSAAAPAVRVARLASLIAICPEQARA